jgi:hypothetical protein
VSWTTHASLLVSLLVALVFVAGTPWAGTGWVVPLVVGLLVAASLVLLGQGMVAWFLSGMLDTTPAAERLPVVVGLGTLGGAGVVTCLAAWQALDGPVVLGSLAMAGAGGWYVHRVTAPPSAEPVLRGTWAWLWEGVPHPTHALALGGAALLALLSAVVPPLGDEATSSHYALARLYLDHGGFLVVPALAESALPLLPVILAATGLGLDPTGVSSSVVGLVLGAAAVLSLADTGRRLFGPTAGWLAMLVAGTCPVLFAAAAVPSAGLPLALFAALTANAVVRYGSGREVGWLVLAGVFTGGALSSCPLAWLGVLPFGLAAVAAVEARARGAASWGGGARVASLAGVALLVVSPTLLRNALFTGTPQVPALPGWLGGHGTTWDHLASLPGRVAVGFTGGEDAGLGLVLPMFVLAGLWDSGPLGVRARVLGLVAAAQGLAWCGTVGGAGGLVPLALTGTLLAGHGLARLRAHAEGPRRALVAGLLGLGLLANAADAGRLLSRTQGDFLPVALGFQDQESYLDAQVEARVASRVAGAWLGPGERLLLHGEDRFLHLEGPLVVTGRWDAGPLRRVLAASSSPDEVLARLKSLGVGALLVHPARMEHVATSSPAWRLSRDEQALLDRFLAQRAVLVHRGPPGGSAVYWTGGAGRTAGDAGGEEGR